MNQIKALYFRFFPFIALKIESYRRKKLNLKKDNYLLKQSFQELCKEMNQISYSTKNEVGHILSMISQDIDLFGQIKKRFHSKDSLKNSTQK